ncbi:MAG: hypothetical protein J6X58_06950 [Bacteroidales bacterium]|nr:hypothetical protein [Bacteroidales bacterium]
MSASLAFIGCTPKVNMDDVVKETNKQMPNVIAEGMVVDRVELDGNYFTYNVITNELYYDVSLIEENYDEVKANILADIRSHNTEDINSFKKACKSAGYGIAYRYVGSETGITATIRIEPEEF